MNLLSRRYMALMYLLTYLLTCYLLKGKGKAGYLV